MQNKFCPTGQSNGPYSGRFAGLNFGPGNGLILGDRLTGLLAIWSSWQ